MRSQASKEAGQRELLTDALRSRHGLTWELVVRRMSPGADRRRVSLEELDAVVRREATARGMLVVKPETTGDGAYRAYGLKGPGAKVVAVVNAIEFAGYWVEEAEVPV